MPVQPIDPVTDARIQHKTAQLNGCTYHYLYAVPPSGQWRGTVFLVRIVTVAITFRYLEIYRSQYGLVLLVAMLRLCILSGACAA